MTVKKDRSRKLGRYTPLRKVSGDEGNARPSYLLSHP
nr:MAG TPA: hypothetical protein [Caudoviricetes sp.]